MHPPGDSVGRDATDEEFDGWRALQRATDKKRADIIADIVGHPQGAPTVEELDMETEGIPASSGAGQAD